MSDDTLRLLADSAASLIASHRDLITDPLGLTGQEAMRLFAREGWFGLAVPEERGGAGFGLAGVVQVARALGWAASVQPFAAAVLSAACLSRLGDVGRLQALLSGTTSMAVAWHERIEGGSLRVREQEGALSGEVRFVHGAHADLFLIPVERQRRLYLAPVSRATKGLTVTDELCPDGSTSARIVLRNVQVPEDAVLGGVTDWWNEATDCGLVTNAAELLGLMDRALEMTLDYMRTRKQFGVPIGSFQALQHRAVDMWIQLRLTEAAVEDAAATLDDANASVRDRRRAAAGAKARASAAALALCNQALQLHGAIGFAEEYGLGAYLNRALTIAPWLGNAVSHRRRFGALYAEGEAA